MGFLPLRLWVTALCAVLHVRVHCACIDPGPGRCNDNISPYNSDSEVVPPSALICRFQGNLCDYRQGCRDVNMIPWTAGKGFAYTRQNETGCGGNSFTVLESRLVQFKIPVCLQFRFSRFSPTVLEVFFRNRTLLGKNDNDLDQDQTQTVERTILESTGKILFRIFGGAPETENVLKLYPVFFQEGRCETPDCSFNNAGRPLCGWTAKNWSPTQDGSASGKKGVSVDSTNSDATLTSPLTRATGPNQKDCLKFRFELEKDEDSLKVALEVSGERTTIWDSHSLGDSSWMDAQVQIVTYAAYKIIFKGRKAKQGGGVMVSDVKVIPKTSETCATGPVDAAVNVTWPLGDPPGPSKGAGSSSGAGAIAGAVVGVLFVVTIAVIGGVLFYRRRLKREPKTEIRKTERPVAGTGAQQQQHEAASNDDYAEIRDSQVLHSAPGGGGYIDVIDDPRPRNAGHGDDVNPYDMADDGSERMVPASGADDYNHLNAGTAPKPSAYLKLPEETKEEYNHIQSAALGKVPNNTQAEGDYNHVGNSRNTPMNDGDYNHIGGSRNSPSGAAGDDYNHIGRSQAGAHHPAANKNRGHGTAGKAAPPRSDPGYELARVEETSTEARQQAVSLPGQDNDGKFSTVQDGKSAKVTREDIHNQTGKTSDPEPTAHAQGLTVSAKGGKRFPQTGGSDGDYSLQKPVLEDPGDYNSLDFDKAGKDSVSYHHDHATTRAPYDHVRSDPDDDYSKTRNGKRTVVIDSDYDHARH